MFGDARLPGLHQFWSDHPKLQLTIWLIMVILAAVAYFDLRKK